MSAPNAELTPLQATPEGYFRDIAPSGEVVFVPEEILVYKKGSSNTLDGTFRLNPENGAAIEATARIHPSVKIGTRVIIEADVRIHSGTVVATRDAGFKIKQILAQTVCWSEAAEYSEKQLWKKDVD